MIFSSSYGSSNRGERLVVGSIAFFNTSHVPGGLLAAGGFGPDGGDLPADRSAGADLQGRRAGGRRKRVIVVEDNEADLFLVREALQAAQVEVELVPFRDGRAAIDHFVAVENDPALPLPDLVLLDLNLPKHNGEEVLAQLRAGTRGARVPVLVVSSSEAPREREALTRLGVAGHFRKPSDFTLFMKLGEIVKQILE